MGMQTIPNQKLRNKDFTDINITIQAYLCMIFYLVGTLRWLRFSTKTQTLIAQRVRQMTRPSEHPIFDISVTVQ